MTNLSKENQMSAQAKTVTRCTYCYKRIHKQRNGAWYHDHNASVACAPGSGGTKAYPKEVVVANDEPRSLGGDLPITRRCWRGEHARCLGSWTAYPDQSGTCECTCHGRR